MALTKKQEEFIAVYLSNGYNATQAYLATHDCSYETASKNSYKLYNNPEVKEEIKRRQKEHYETLNISAERIAEELASMAFAAKGDKDYSGSVKLKALDLLQKQLGLQTQKIEADLNTDINITIEE
jgi:phage terminase small subunit